MKRIFIFFSVSVSILIVITPAITEYYGNQDYENWNSDNYEDWNSENYENRDIEKNEYLDSGNYNNRDAGYYGNRNPRYIGYRDSGYNGNRNSGNYENRNAGYYGDRNSRYYRNRYPEHYRHQNKWNWWNWQYWWDWQGWQQWNKLWYDSGITKTICDDIVPLTPLYVELADKTVVRAGQKIMGAKTLLIPPYIEWPCDVNEFYTAVLLNLDVVLIKKGYQYVHWRVDGIRGCEGLGSGVVTMPYLTGPTALPATGVNRYAIFVFATGRPVQQDLSTVVASVAKRNNFNAAECVERWGPPIAGTFFEEQSSLVQNVDLRDVAPVKVLPLV